LCFQSINSYQSINYISCDNPTKNVFGTDTVSISWTLYAGASSCVLPLSFSNTRKFSVTVTSTGSGYCYHDAANWSCNTGYSYTSCPAMMYSLSSLSNIGTSIITRKTYLSSSFIKLKYCGNSATRATITIDVDAITSNTNYWYWSSSWQFVCIGIPVIGISLTIFLIALYVWLRQRRNRIQVQQQHQMTPTVRVTTSYGGGTNPGFQGAQTTNQPYIYPQQPEYNYVYPAPPSNNQTGYIQGPVTK